MYPKVNLSIHATNIAGAGAVKLVESLLPVLENQSDLNVKQIHLPNRGSLSSYTANSNSAKLLRYVRILPNSVSRVLECTLFSRQFESDAVLLVLGDIALRVRTKQVLLLHSPHMVDSRRDPGVGFSVKYFVSKIIFRVNLRFVTTFVVQTQHMKAKILREYPVADEKVVVIGLPAPLWLDRTFRYAEQAPYSFRTKPRLRLFYPAAYYPHKNHGILGEPGFFEHTFELVEKVVLTINEENNPAPSVSWISCVGSLSETAVNEEYKNCDALLFLSHQESYGFPLIEAMTLGLPIVCTRLCYS
jgi:hypothetical protein